MSQKHTEASLSLELNAKFSHLESRDNNFDALRFVFASFVILSHSWP